MEILNVLRHRSQSRDSDRNEGTPRNRLSPTNPDSPVQEDYDDSHSIATSEYDLPESYDRIQQTSLVRYYSTY
jgi:hypothetical protein